MLVPRKLLSRLIQCRKPYQGNALAKIGPGTLVPLDLILEHITKNIYDYWHGLGPAPEWSLDMVPFMDMLAEHLRVSPEELGRYFDEIRYRVHGEELRAKDNSGT